MSTAQVSAIDMNKLNSFIGHHRVASFAGRLCVRAPIDAVTDDSSHRIPGPPIRVA